MTMYSTGDPHMDAILKQRARELARAPVVEDDTDSAIVVVFSLGEHQYAIQASSVREVVALDTLTVVPCTPDFVAGIVNIRGSLLSLVNLGDFLELPVHGLTDLNQILVVQAAGLEVGLLTHEVLGMRLIPSGEIKAPLPNDENVAREYVFGVTTSLIVMLDIERIFSDSRLIVHEEVMK
jgi:purine-binding chemotaxis protein CheW